MPIPWVPCLVRLHPTAVEGATKTAAELVESAIHVDPKTSAA